MFSFYIHFVRPSHLVGRTVDRTPTPTMASPDRLTRDDDDEDVSPVEDRVAAQTNEESEDEEVAADSDVFVYIVRVPFHPQRLARTLREHFDELRFDDGDDDGGRHASTGASSSSSSSAAVFKGVYRATGACWIASRPRLPATFEFEDVYEEEEEEEEDADDDDINYDSRYHGRRVVRVCCADGKNWDATPRGACEIPADATNADVVFCGGDRRQHLVFEGFDIDAMKIKECLDACLLTHEEDADETNHGSEWRDYCGCAFPSPGRVLEDAGVEVVDRGVKHKVFFPSDDRTTTTTTTMAEASLSKDDVDDIVQLGGDVGVKIPEAFEIPSTTSATTHSKTFPNEQIGQYFPDMPCLACGSPWWLGEDWNSKCANCGADDRCYGADQRPAKAYRRKYAEFTRALARLAL